MDLTVDHEPGEVGACLVSTLLAVAIIAVMAAMVMSSTNYSLELPVLEPTQPTQSEASPSAGGGVPAVLDEARQLTCQTNVELVAGAVSRKQALDGTFPLSIEELVAGGWLDPAILSDPQGITVEVVDGVGTGRILVNGQAGPAGCFAQ